MSNYKAHSTFNLLVALPCFTGAALFLLSPRPEYLYTFIGSFAYGTLFMSPDLDLAYKIKLFSLRGLLSIPFRFYALVFRHRGLSHSVLFGTLTRVLWLMLFINVVVYFVYNRHLDVQALHRYFLAHRDYILACFFGLFLADISHLFLDRRFI